jgi:hypothetical protein
MHNSRPKLTIGFATFDDWHGAYFTLSALLMYHELAEVELLVIDNCPTDIPQRKQNSEALRNLVDNFICKSAGVRARYVHSPEAIGTSSPRDRVFREATGEAVLCIDSHVLLPTGAVDKLLGYYKEHAGTNDLLSGPILWDDLKNGATHFNDVWRHEMWGIWGQAWMTPCGEEEGDHFSVIESEGKKARFVALEMGARPLRSIARCGFEFPDIPFPGHEKTLIELGCRRLGWSSSDVFEIPGQGLGLFSARKEAWPGFNPHARGFGGEEMYIHEKFRRRGDRCLCLGFLKWSHRFHRGQSITYPLTRWNKVRNYVLEHNELGLPLDPVKEHFINGASIPNEDWDMLWDYLIADPINHVSPPSRNPLVTSAVVLPGTLDELFDTVSANKRDLDQHMPKLRELASQSERVTDISGRKESFIAFAAAVPRTLVSHNLEWNDPLAERAASLAKAAGSDVAADAMATDEVESIVPTDLLFIDTKHTGAQFAKELAKWAANVSRFIVRHDTQVFGDRGEDNAWGLLWTIRDFVESDDNPWFVAWHTETQYGLTVLGRREEDRPAQPIEPWKRGPGSELKLMLRALSINPPAHCDCNKKAAQMDKWGVEGCMAHRDEIIGWMQEGQSRWGWKDRIAAGFKTITTGLVFHFNPLDPWPGIIDEAIRRADEPQSKRWTAA